MPGDQGAFLEEEHDDGPNDGCSPSMVSVRPDTTYCNDFFKQLKTACLPSCCLCECVRMGECIHGGVYM